MKLPVRLTVQRVLIILMGVSAITSLLGSRAAGKVRILTHWVIAPFGDAGMYVTNTVRTSVGRPRTITEDDLRRWEAEKHAFEGRVVYLQARLSEQTAENQVLRGHVAHLQELLSGQREEAPGEKGIFGRLQRAMPPYELIPARVVMRDSMPYGSTGILVFGGAAGLRPGARVTTRHLLTDRAKALPEGRAAITDCVLVGQLAGTWAFGASLRLVTDRGFRVNGRIHRIIKDDQNPRMIEIIELGKARSEPLTDENNQPVPAFAEGDGEGLVATGISENYHILPGDVFATREDGFVPAPMLVGKVVQVTKDPKEPGRVIVRIKPAADLDNLRLVYIVVPFALGPER